MLARQLKPQIGEVLYKYNLSCSFLFFFCLSFTHTFICTFEHMPYQLFSFRFVLFFFCILLLHLAWVGFAIASFRCYCCCNDFWWCRCFDLKRRYLFLFQSQLCFANHVDLQRIYFFVLLHRLDEVTKNKQTKKNIGDEVW